MLFCLQDGFALVLVFQLPVRVPVRCEGSGENELFDVEVLLERCDAPASLVAVEERLHIRDLDVSLLLVQLVSLNRL